MGTSVLTFRDHPRLLDGNTPQTAPTRQTLQGAIQLPAADVPQQPRPEAEEAELSYASYARLLALTSSRAARAAWAPWAPPPHPRTASAGPGPSWPACTDRQRTRGPPPRARPRHGPCPSS
uniref:Uncharacterized protein n=1 Tax=Arundo donax TaxID=35708 RepID=A0A0A9GD13_ARUDO